MTLFRKAEDLAFFCHRLAILKRLYECEVYAYCLMSNHFHLLLRGGALGIGKLMHRLMTAYAVRFNGRYDHTGHVFEDRYWSKECLDDRYFLAAIRYINRNPVAAGLVQRPLDWKYSGHREMLGQAGQGLIDAAFPLACFAENIEQAREEYIQFVDDVPRNINAAAAAIQLLRAQEGFMAGEPVGSRRFSLLRAEAIRSAYRNGATSAEIMAAFECSAATISRARNPRDPKAGVFSPAPEPVVR